MENINATEDPNLVVDPLMTVKLAFLYTLTFVPVIWAITKLIPKMMVWFH